MRYNDGADIIPGMLAVQLLPAGANTDMERRYARYQRLTLGAMQSLVFEAWDNSKIAYGSDSPDFPLCRDFSRWCVAYVTRRAHELGLAVRPALFVVDYTQIDGGRHSITGNLNVDGSRMYYDPQTPTDVASWTPEPWNFRGFEAPDDGWWVS